MSETEITHIENQEQAQAYLQDVRQSYRNGESVYKGTLNEYQRMAETISAEEGRIMLDGVMAGLVALGGASLPDDYESIGRAGHTWADFRGEFERALARITTISGRLDEKGLMKGYAELDEGERVKVASELLRNFNDHNALRFGVDGAGIPAAERQTIYTDDGGIEHKTIRIDDKDKARSNRTIDRNIAERGYKAKGGNHPSIKMSPEEYVEHRRNHPMLDKDKFDHIVSFNVDAGKGLETEDQ